MISIIVPLYNAGKYLHECIESVISQTFSDWELIIVDDGSTDSSGQIADEYALKDLRIKVFHVENGGPSYARNIGIDNAKGDFLAFLDSDDALFSNSLKSLSDAMSDYDADLVAGDFVNGKSYKNVDKTAWSAKAFDSQEAIESALYQSRFNPSPWGKLYKKECFVEIRYKEGLLYEDLDIFYKIFLLCGKIVYISSPVYFYRKTSGSLLHTWDKKRLDVLKVTEDIEIFMDKFFPRLLPAARDRRLSANFNMFALASIHGDGPTADQCWELIRNYRKASLFNPRVRLKNKAGIILSYFGRRMFTYFCKLIYNK